MKCKQCHPVFGHKLRQTGKSNPVSYECVACGTEHDDDGQLSSLYVAPEADDKLKCPYCGSKDTNAYGIYVTIYKCLTCGKSFSKKMSELTNFA